MANLPVPESSGRKRHLYLVEIGLGLAFLAIVGIVIYSNNQSGPSGNDKGGYIVLSDQNWKAEVLDSKVPVLVEFWGEG